jgi:L-fuculose-phosphate aldolase
MTELEGLDWRAMAEVGRDVFALGLVTSHGGNLSVRRPSDGALITATGAMLGHLEQDHFVPVDRDGRRDNPLSREPSSDTRVHLAVYRAVPEARAVLHAHPVYATTLSFDWQAVEPRNLEGRLYLPRIPVLGVEWEESAEPVAEALREVPAVLVRGHGTYVRASDPWEALKITSALEESAQILYLLGRR